MISVISRGGTLQTYFSIARRLEDFLTIFSPLKLYQLQTRRYGQY